MAGPNDTKEPRVNPLPDPLPITQEHLRLTELNEGYRRYPYRDTVGVLTVGFGRNLEAVGVSREEAGWLAHVDLTAAYDALIDLDGAWVLYLDPVRQAAFTDLVYNMGIGSWRKFRNTRDAAARGDFEGVIAGLRNSKWYGQVGKRAERIIGMIQTGRWPWE